jgi:two-component system response regulator AdeR
MNELILIAEDEPEIVKILDGYLSREGFRTVSAANGQIALDQYAIVKPDLVLLDLNMPKIDGWEVLAELRRRGATPVIVITALDEDIDRLQGLRLGADDYVVKPFNPAEVVARAKAVLRRSKPSGSQAVLRIDKLEIDLEGYLAKVLDNDAATPLPLTLTEFRILAHMAKSPMRAFSRSELVDACLPGSDALERTVDSHVSNLRRKLDQAGASGMMSVVRGVGYRLAEL